MNREDDVVLTDIHKERTNRHMASDQDAGRRELVLLEEIARNTRASKKNTRTFLTIIAACMAVLTLTIIITCVSVTKSVNKAVEDLEATTESINTLTKDAQVVINKAQTMLEDNEVAITQTMEKINNIDFDSLNNSIKSLSEVIEPLSKFFGIMGGASGASR